MDNNTWNAGCAVCSADSEGVLSKGVTRIQLDVCIQEVPYLGFSEQSTSLNHIYPCQCYINNVTQVTIWKWTSSWSLYQFVVCELKKFPSKVS